MQGVQKGGGDEGEGRSVEVVVHAAPSPPSCVANKETLSSLYQMMKFTPFPPPPPPPPLSQKGGERVIGLVCKPCPLRESGPYIISCLHYLQ